MRFIDVYITCPDTGVAERIAEAAVAEKLAACANIGGPVASIYAWKGARERTDEVPLTLKTRETLFEPLCDRVKDLHPYETPCIISTRLKLVEAAYAEWLAEETREA